MYFLKLVFFKFSVYCCKVSTLFSVSGGEKITAFYLWVGGAWWAVVRGVARNQTQLSDFTFTHWRRKWQPVPVFLPGESQGRGSLMGCRLWGRTESDTTEAT